MPRFIIQAFLGIILFSTGTPLGFITIKHFNNDTSLPIVCFAILLAGGGIYYLLRAKQTYATIKALAESQKSAANQPGLQNRLERDSALISEWEQSNQQKDKLKILQMSETIEGEK